jgi:hypothetical protein
MDDYREWYSERCARMDKVPRLAMKRFVEYEKRREKDRKPKERIVHSRLNEVLEKWLLSVVGALGGSRHPLPVKKEYDKPPPGGFLLS